MDPVTKLSIFLISLLLIPLALKILNGVLPLIREHLAAAILNTRTTMMNAFRYAGSTVTLGFTLSTPIAIAQVTGAILLASAGVVFAVSDYQLTWATLCPMFAGDCKGEVFGEFEKILGVSTVLLAVTFGLHLTDLLGLTSVTRYAVTNRRGLGAFAVVVVCFLSSLALWVFLAAYRDAAMATASETISDQALERVQMLRVLTLLPLAALLFIGTAYAFMSLETFGSAVVAFISAVFGCLLATLRVVMRLADFVAEILLQAVAILLEFFASIPRVFRGLAGQGANYSNSILKKLRGMVAVPASTSEAKSQFGGIGSSDGHGPEMKPARPEDRTGKQDESGDGRAANSNK